MKAYHIVGFASPGDSVRLGRLDDRGLVLQRLQDRHQAIIASGVLRPSSSFESSRMFALDRLAGDDQYVFLSLGKRYWLSSDDANFGFVFDAERLLLEHGAILRGGDLMQDYEDILDEVVSEYTKSASPEHWTEEETKALFAALENPDATDGDYKSPNDDYFTLCNAVEHGDTSVPYASEATEQFVYRAKRLQEQRQCTGQRAVTLACTDVESGRYELLVPGELAINLAIASIQHGQEAPI